MKKSRSLTAAALLAVGISLASTAGPAQAATVSGWTGTTLPNSEGFVFLHNSTIINSPAIRAESAIWSAFGQSMPPGYLGVRARLFKSGVLCQAVDYRYNLSVVTKWTYGTTSDCGTGSYNSHGFVNYNDPTNGRQEVITFPSNPLNYTSPAARGTAVDATVQSGVNSAGQSFGSADVEAAADLPDLIQVFTKDGQVGYITKADFEGPGAAASPQEAIARGTETRSVPVYDSDGVAKVGEFRFGK